MARSRKKVTCVVCRKKKSLTGISYEDAERTRPLCTRCRLTVGGASGTKRFLPLHIYTFHNIYIFIYMNDACVCVFIRF
jgi:hypothetical protein